MSDTSSEDLGDKMNKLHVDDVFTCQYPGCSRTFTEWGTYVTHIGKHTMIIKKPESSSDEDDQSVDDNDESAVINFKPYKCNIDDGYTNSVNKLTCPFETCDRYSKPYVNKGSLKNHMDKMHSSKIANKQSNIKSSNEFNIEQLREEDGQYHCDSCEFIGNKWTVKKHRITHLSKDEQKRIKCEFKDCSVDFARRDNMLSHMRSAHPSNPSDRIPCTFAGCGKQLKDMKNFKLHMKSHDPNAKRYYCLIKGCSNEIGFGKKGDVARHRKSHKNDIFSCDKCDMEFTTQSALATHYDEEHSE
jgi:hypothetical protein